MPRQSKQTRSTDSYDSDLDLRMSCSPSSPLQFVLTYESVLEEAKEAEYERLTTTCKILTGVLFGVLALVSLCLFMVSITLIGTSFSLLLSCHARSAFLLTDHPISGLAVGILATALVHSSSTVTSLMVSLVGSNEISLRSAVYVVMGANIGTCVTAVMVAFAQARNRTQFQRALGAAMLHTMYNVWSVVVLLPLEFVLHPLEKLSCAMAKTDFQGIELNNPIKALVVPLADRLLKLEDGSTNEFVIEGECNGDMSLVYSGALTHASASHAVVGWISLAVGFITLIVTLVLLSKVFSLFLMGGTKRIVSSIGRCNGYVGILGGTLFTFLVSSSTLSTSIFTPIVGLGGLSMDQVYPLIIGANLGTSVNALFAAFASTSPDAIALAFVGFWFNVFGIPLCYVMRRSRRPVFIPAYKLAKFGASWIPFATLFTLLVFYLGPSGALHVVSACRSAHPASVIIGYTCVALICSALVWGIVWYTRHDGRHRIALFFERKRIKHEIHRHGGNLAMPVVVNEMLI